MSTNKNPASAGFFVFGAANGAQVRSRRTDTVLDACCTGRLRAVEKKLLARMMAL